MLKAISLDHFVLRVRDLDAALRFYHDILGLPIEWLDEYRAGARPFVSARVGGQLIDLVPDPTYDPAESAYKGGYLHCCIEIEGKLIEIVPWLAQRGVEVIESEPVSRMGARGIGLSIYVKDPDGYIVELKERHA
ncbi:MAG: VOC family protein [Deltaproteobacteria bacterium]|nr:VOC family protein [Deltaproteobacteria bacterium]